MPKVITLIVVLIFVITELYPQGSSRGASVSVAPEVSGTIRAVIIGISDYKNLPENKQLAYADDDAMEFYNFLSAREEIDPKNLYLFLNEEASNDIIRIALLNTLIKDPQPNDFTIIYFAGHGDVDSDFGDGYLLLHDVASDGDYEASDALLIGTLQRYVSQATENGVKVLVITDACRSGRIVGEDSGVKNTLTALSREWENTFKLVSCQPNELSFEDEKWGGGHGVFTYYLLKGLHGMASKNDAIITFGELYKYVWNSVEEATESQQNPVAVGDKTSPLFVVNKDKSGEFLASAKGSDDKFAARKIETSKTSYKRNVPTIPLYFRSLYDKALENGDYINPEKDQKILSKTENGIRIKKTTVYSSLPSKISYAVTFSPDGKTVITGSDSKKIDLYSVQNKIEDKKAWDHPGVLCLETSYNGNLLASAGWNNKIMIWSLDDDQLIKTFVAHNTDIRSLKFTPDGNYLVSGANNGSIKIWDTHDWTLIKTLKKHSNRITSLSIDWEGKLLISTSWDGRFIAWDLHNYSVKKTMNVGTKINAGIITANQKYFISGNANGKIIVWDLATLSQIEKYTTGLSALNDIETDFEGRYIFAAGKEFKIIIIDNEKNKILPFNIQTKRGICDLSISPVNDKLSAVTYGGELYLVDLDIPKKNLKYVIDIIDYLATYPQFEHLSEKLKGLLCVHLQKFAQYIIDSFLKGEEVLPAESEVKKAILELKLAYDLYKDEKVISDKILTRKLLLETYLTIMTNDYSNFDKAISNINKIIEIEPHAAYTQNTLAVIYKKLNDVLMSQKSAKNAGEKIPNWTEPKCNMGKAFLAEGKYDLAIEEFNKIVSLQPKISKGYLNLAEVYALKGNFMEAEKNFLTAIKVDPQNPYLYCRYAELKAKTGQINEAQKLFEKSISIDDKYHYSYLCRGKTFHYEHKTLSGKSQKSMLLLKNALRDINKAKELAPNDPAVLCELADLYITLVEAAIQNLHGSFSVLKSFSEKEVSNKRSISKTLFDCRKLALKVIKLDPYNPKPYALVCIAGYLLTEYREKDKDKQDEKPDSYLKKVLEKVPDDPNAHYYYGLFIEKSSKAKKAREFYKKAIDLNPYFFPAYIALYNLSKADQKGEVSNYNDIISNLDLFSNDELRSDYLLLHYYY